MVWTTMHAAPLPCPFLIYLIFSIVIPTVHPVAIAYASIAFVTEDLHTHPDTCTQRDRERVSMT